MDNDPILEENENEVDDDVLSENNFYLTWENHKRYLLTQDEQMKLLNEDARSSTGFFERTDRYHRGGAWSHNKIGGSRHRRKKGVVDDGDKKMVLDPIEENKDDPNEEGEDHESISGREEPRKIKHKESPQQRTDSPKEQNAHKQTERSQNPKTQSTSNPRLQNSKSKK